MLSVNHKRARKFRYKGQLPTRRAGEPRFVCINRLCFLQAFRGHGSGCDIVKHCKLRCIPFKMTLAMCEKQQDITSLLGQILLLQKSNDLDRRRGIAVTLYCCGDRDTKE